MAVPDLFSNVGGLYGSGVAGYDVGQQQTGTTLENLLRATQVARGAMDNQYDEANLPTRIQQSAANLQSTMGQNQTRDLSNAFTTATQPDAISATNSNNAAVPTKNMAAEQAEKLQMYTGLAAKFSTMQPAERVATASGLAKQYPGIANDPEFENILSHPENALQGYIKVAQSMPKNVLEQDKDNTTASRAITLEKMRTDSAEKIAQMKVESAAKLAAAKNQAATDLPSIAAKGGPMKAAAYAEAMSARATDPDEKTIWDNETARYRTMAESLASAGKPAVPQVPGINYVPVPGNSGGPVALPGPRQDQGAASVNDPLGIR